MNPLLLGSLSKLDLLAHRKISQKDFTSWPKHSQATWLKCNLGITLVQRPLEEGWPLICFPFLKDSSVAVTYLLGSCLPFLSILVLRWLITYIEVTFPTRYEQLSTCWLKSSGSHTNDASSLQHGSMNQWLIGDCFPLNPSGPFLTPCFEIPPLTSGTPYSQRESMKLSHCYQLQYHIWALFDHSKIVEHLQFTCS